MEYSKFLEELMTQVAEAGASDLHIAVGRHPVLRVSGQLVPLTKKPILTQADTAGLVEAMMGKEWFQEFLQNKEKDFSYSYKDKIRFRVNVYFQKGFIGAALRIVPYKIKTLEELNIPQILAEFSKKEQGFFLVVGPTGHGKSTTLAALIDLINHTRTEHIITIEDPIEYIFLPDRSMIDQREVGLDTKDFATALRSMFREDVNVAMIGEMRDHETMAAAVTAAETGHLIFSSLHTNNAAQTIDRIIDTFPGAQQGQIRTQLASTLIGIFSQRLVPRISGGLIPAYELLLSNAAVRNLIRENKVHEIDLVIETNAEVGMVSFNRSLIDLVRRGEITMENALLFSLNPQELRILAGK
ncbi:type IV pili twitching motility protein PilT [Candidatus Giovannonibacteria bacterium RIFCSPLOWO2_01_FULL_43_160]|uniref:Type IV pili twitching motility protein PilT n=2 Tax=Candidatus Giovannoniibacteriota TaxID=1752738 RepID=A0A1F5XVL4_9BACT|nr:MAG: type IV pili twitching motility protein PilT [Candidatus Giovannonibacteria bacterium RIFCSPHIGHO2_01_FULL_43_140]OGF70765.1 MAG: type IV pili twitching motility protein PilT [Candidatus Giovannonibacteria bacterium RIFCSPHIGHO2_02_FULL_44_51]OGF71138.1 MAG: type IV pili twitching motility protein PilT [Candidatus Giovannonibacteria bacterium RIFCSPHIGHO2_12_FULL_44_22]OGF76635.1 MAG: type IV pili twitching motility protein PilT [Candidatus Giovannonibacteria bacterium RIFCSPLOWO2_01_FUL